MSSKKISDEEFEKLSFGNEKIAIEIPKCTDIMIVTTLSTARNGGNNLQSKIYNQEEIKSFKLER